jgi:hypothetical protein
MNRICLILIAGIIMLMPACITIEENYTFKKNGSGDAEYIIDMSEMGSLIKMAQEEEGVSLEDEMDVSLLSDRLIGIAGISKVDAIDGAEDFIFGVKFHFDGISSLNAALNALNGGEDMMGADDHEYFSMEGKTIKRNHKMSEALDLNELLGEAGTGEEGEMEQMAMFMESMKYKLNMTFKKPIQAVYTSADSKFLDKKNKQVEIVATFKQVMDDQTVLNASIVTK